MKTEAGMREMLPPDKRCQELLEAGRSERILPAWPCHIWIQTSGLQNCEMINFCCVKSASL